MGAIFDFDRLIRKYSTDCLLVCGADGGKYEAGNWIPGSAKEPEPVSGAIIPMANRKIYQSGGTYTEHDREFVTRREIPLEPAAYLIHEEARYEVQEGVDYSKYAGFYTYNLKRVSVFDKPEKH